MGRAIALAAALSLAGCKLDYEGARCNTPGSAAECPSGQACGNDRTCSTRAAVCADFCTPGASASASPKRCKTGSAAIETCTSADPICGAWTVSTTCATDLVCGGSGGAPACVCAAPSAEIHVDPAAPVDATLTPTGAASPDACRFRKLGDALTFARTTWLPANAAPATVSITAHGAPAGGSPVTFDAESFPLLIPSRATLKTSAATPASADWIITAPAGTADLVDLEGGATIEGFTIKTTAATGDGVVISCPPGVTAPATLADVVISGGGTLSRGVVVAASCGAVLRRVDVGGSSLAALDVTASAAPVTVSGSRFHLSGTGIRASGGTLVLGSDATAPTELSGNAAAGLQLTLTSPLNVSLSDAVVSGNGGSGLAVNGAAAAVLALSGVQISSNGGDGIAVSMGGAGTATLTSSGGQLSTNSGAGIAISGAGPVGISVAGGQVTGNKSSVGGIAMTGAAPVSLTLSGGVEVSGNTGAGVLAAGSGAAGLTLTDVQVIGNGGTGIVVGSVPVESSLTLARCVVHSNAKTAPTQYGPAPRRNAGGLLVSSAGLLATFDLKQNQFYANPPSGVALVADQLAFETGSIAAAWPLNQDADGVCANANAIACVNASGYSINVLSPYTVSARNTRWPAGGPATGGFVDTASPCAWTPPACP